jgi:Uma2 family endonuclease
MSEGATTKLMTSEEFFALPDDDDVERWLINGELRTSEDRPMTKRNPFHCSATAAITHLLMSWLGRQPQPRGLVLTGDAYFRLRRNPDVNVGIDVAYAPAELTATLTRKSKFLDGPPTLAVEVLSPGDKHEEVTEKISAYLESGVRLVWVLSTELRTVTVCRPDAQPQMFNVDQELSGDPHLPGFRVPVAAIFQN